MGKGILARLLLSLSARKNFRKPSWEVPLLSQDKAFSVVLTCNLDNMLTYSAKTDWTYTLARATANVSPTLWCETSISVSDSFVNNENIKGKISPRSWSFGSLGSPQTCNTYKYVRTVSLPTTLIGHCSLYSDVSLIMLSIALEVLIIINCLHLIKQTWGHEILYVSWSLKYSHSCTISSVLEVYCLLLLPPTHW